MDWEFVGFTDNGHSWFRGKCNCKWGRVTVEAYMENGFWVWDYACGHGRKVIKEEQLEDEKMAMNLMPTSEEDFVPFIKYNARMGGFYVKGDDGEPDVQVLSPKMAFDFANARTGWFLFAAGMAPQKHFDPPEGTAEKPGGGNFKRGFELSVWNPELGLRQFGSCANAVIIPILAMEKQYDAGKAEHSNQLPVFQFTGTEKIVGTKNTNYAPVFELVEWVDVAKVHPPEVKGDDIPF